MLPLPTSVRPQGGAFTLRETTGLGGDRRFIAASRWLRGVLQASTGFDLDARIDLRTDSIAFIHDGAVVPGGYHLEVGAEGVRIAASDASGAFSGAVTLTQLLPAEANRRALVRGVDWTVQATIIDDEPRFGWRGVMLDVARHFLPKADVLRFIDLAARHKLNVLHFHLTDDQGWRVEIDAFPRLTEVGGWRTESQHGAARHAPGDGRPHGGFYTKDDLREIVAYAADRSITVVPEIDLPGHARAIIAAYPELAVPDVAQDADEPSVWTRWGINEAILDMGEETVAFFRTVFDEVMEVFPSTFIGVGGDEAKKARWAASARTQALMAERGLASVEELQAWFIRQLEAHLAAAGRRLYGWDEILEGGGLPQGATVASWRGEFGAVAAARSGHDVIACPDDRVYLDYRESDDPREPIPVGPPLTIAEVYALEPVPAELTDDEAKHVIGVQANIWTEHMDSARVIDYQAYPRLCALAEVAWVGRERDFAGFESRLEQHLERLDALGVEYRRASGPMPWQERPDAEGRPSTREQRAALVAELTKDIRA
ncbi:beta-N-acetylhexosaminidase [Plantibacter flavus]|uniref:beta-N-acetylhexosaminidase n=1 Tax=Plantibacter flavus TaxID=150123 RepID=UPI003F17979C